MNIRKYIPLLSGLALSLLTACNADVGEYGFGKKEESLQEQVQQGNLKGVKRYLKNGASPTACCDEHPESAWIMAVKRNNRDIVKAMLKSGRDITSEHIGEAIGVAQGNEAMVRLLTKQRYKKVIP